MKITETFISDILEKEYGKNFQKIYDNSLLLQYLDKKMKAIHGNSKTRRSLANIYAIYSILYFYQEDFYENKELYCKFDGYDYTKLLNFCRNLYGGRKLQNHALNSRVNGEFNNKFKGEKKELIIVNNSKYLIHIGYIYVFEYDISKVICKIIEKYIELLMIKDNELMNTLDELLNLTNFSTKKNLLNSLLTENSEARIFEIISYAILKNHYKNIKVFFGYKKDDIKEVALEVFKTGRTNANDGGIDFVMRPVGRFFQVTEVNSYDKYLLDIDKVMHFPITFVVKTKESRVKILIDLKKYIEEHSSGMNILKERYNKAIEEIITINELQKWIDELSDSDIDEIIKDIDIYYRLEMNINMIDEI